VPSEIDISAKKPVVIIGFMGTGKTTVGRLVAARLDRRFVDLDDLIVQAAGRPVADIFKQEGEGGFRKREKVALEQALADAGTVIATGGGAACREDNLALLLARGQVVALSATPEEVLRRTGRASGRPLLDGAGDPLTAARHLLSQREEFYGRAHVQIDTGGKRPEEVATEVLKSLAGLTAREQQEEAR
jgi:shikimate kinase